MSSFLIVLSFCFNLWAQDISIPALRSPVMDEAHLLNESEREDLSELAYEIFAHSGPQITILTLNNLQGFPIEEFSIRVAEKWQLGSEKKDNGLLILISKDERKIRIEVGNGIEGEITDFDANKYIQHIITPAFKKGLFHQGLRIVMEDVAKRFEITLSQKSKIVRRAPRVNSSKFQILLPIVIIILLLSQLFLGQRPVARGLFSGAGIAGISYFFLPALGLGIIFLFFLGGILGLIGVNNLLYMLASSGGGHFGGHHGGSGGSSWGGGGGGFSGGGSSGNW